MEGGPLQIPLLPDFAVTGLAGLKFSSVDEPLSLNQ